MSGGIRAGIDAATGGPGRRRRRMMRRLEELDRLDARARNAEEVVWPSGRSSRTDPRAWNPPASGRRDRTGPWWERHRSASVVVIVAVIAGVLVWPNELIALFPGRAERPAGIDVPSRSNEASDSRLLPAVTVPGGVSTSAFAWMSVQGDGSPVTFDPCRPIHYVTRTVPGAPDEGVVHEAVAIVSAASGLRFVHDGPTDETPTEGRAPFQPERYGDRWAPVLVAWTSSAESPELGDNAGLGGGIPWRDTSGRLSYVSGTVWLDTGSAGVQLDRANGRERVRGVVVHELAHVLGAGHPAAGDQLMSERGDGSPTLARGDRHALAVLGNGPCVPGL